MSTKTRISNAERLGRWLGGVWRGYVRQERRAAGWLSALGLPPGGTTALLWGVKLVVLGGLLYVASWLALLFVFAVAAAWAVEQSHPVEEFELQFPTTLEELRQTPGYDPNLYNDTSHEMYRDDD